LVLSPRIWSARIDPADATTSVRVLTGTLSLSFPAALAVDEYFDAIDGCSLGMAISHTELLVPFCWKLQFRTHLAGLASLIRAHAKQPLDHPRVQYSANL